MSRADYLNALFNQRKQRQANGNVIVDPSLGKVATLDTSFKNKTSTPKPDLNANPVKSTVKTVEELGSNITEGVTSFIDSVGDFLLLLGGSISGGVNAMFGGSFDEGFDWAKQAMTYDWESQFVNAINQTVGMLPGVFTGETFTQDYWKGWEAVGSAEESRKNIDKLHSESYTSLLGENGQNIYNSITTGIGNVLPSIALGIATGGASVGAQLAIGGASAFIQGFGAQAEEAIKEGADVGQAVLSGAIGGVAEAGTEMLFMGVGKGLNAAKKGISKLTGKAVSETASSFGQHILGKNISKPFAKMTFKEIASSAIEEGTEEFITELFSPLAKSVYKGEEELKAYNFGSPEWFDLIGQASISFVGGAVGGLFGTGVNSAITTKTFSKQGKEIINKTAEIKTLQQDVINEAMKSNPDTELLGQAQERLGQAYKEITDGLNSLKTTNNKAYENVVKLLSDPKNGLKILEKNTEGVENIEVARESIDKTFGKDTTQLVIDELNNTLSQKGVNATIKVGNVRDGKAVYKAKDGAVIIDKNHVDEIGSLARHEILSHVILDSDVATRENLIKYIESNKTLSKEFHKYDKQLRKQYKAKDISKERLAFFLENVLSDKSKFDKVFKGNAFTKLLNTIKAKFNNVDAKVLGALQTALGKKQTQLEGVSYAKDLNETSEFIRSENGQKVKLSDFENAIGVIEDTASQIEDYITENDDGDIKVNKKFVNKLENRCERVLEYVRDNIYDGDSSFDSEYPDYVDIDKAKKVGKIFTDDFITTLEQCSEGIYSADNDAECPYLDEFIEFAKDYERNLEDYIEDFEEYSKGQETQKVETKKGTEISNEEKVKSGKTIDAVVYNEKAKIGYNKRTQEFYVEVTFSNGKKWQYTETTFNKISKYVEDNKDKSNSYFDEFKNETSIKNKEEPKTENAKTPGIKLDTRNVYTFKTGNRVLRVESLQTFDNDNNTTLIDTDAWEVTSIKDNDTSTIKKKTFNTYDELSAFLAKNNVSLISTKPRKATETVNTIKTKKVEKTETKKQTTNAKPKRETIELGIDNVIGDNDGGKKHLASPREDLVKFNATTIKQAALDRVVDLKTSNEIVDFTLDFIAKRLGKEVKFDNKQEFSFKTFANYALLDEKAKVDFFGKVANDITNAEVSIIVDNKDGTKSQLDITIKEYLEYKGENSKEFVDTLAKTLHVAFDVNSKVSVRQQALNKLEQRLAKMQKDFMVFRATAKQNFELGVQFRKAKEEIKGLTEKGANGDVRIDKEIDFLNVLLSNKWVTRTGKVSGQIRKLAYELSQKQHTFIDRNGNTVTGNTFDMIQNSQEIGTMIPDYLFDFFRKLAYTYNDARQVQKTLRFGEVYELNYAIKTLRGVVKDFKEEKYQKLEQDHKTAYNKINFVNNSIKVSGIKSKIMGGFQKFTSPITNMKVATGGLDVATDYLVNQPIEAYSKKRLEQAKLERKLESIVKKSVIERDGNKTVNWKTDNGKQIKIKRHDVYGLYMNMQCDYNKSNILVRGYEIILDDGTKYIIRNNDNLEETIKNTLTEQEIEILEKLSDLLNGDIKKYAQSAQEKVDHFSTMLDERYYPNTISDGNNPTYVDKKRGASFMVDASNTGFLRSRSGNRNALRIVNPVSLITSYIDSITTYGEISQTQKVLERFINKKMDGDRTILQVINEFNPDFTKQYTSYIKKLIGSPVTQKEEGILSNLAGKYATAVLGYNVGTVLTQTASLPTAMSLTGVRSGAKALVLSKKFGEQGIRETYKWLIANNGIFSYRVLNHGFIKGETGSNKFNQYASKVLNGISEFGLKGMEAMDTLMCVLSFKMAQQTVQDTKGYKIGTDENYSEANKLFNHIILETQSNSDPIAKSMLRSGEMGNMMRYTFGMFASDAQNKLSLFYENVVNGYRNKRTYKMAKDMIEKNNFGKYTRQEVQEIYNETKGKLNFYNKSIGRYFALLLASGAAAELAKILRDLFYGKDLNKEPGEWVWEFANETFVEWIPMVGSFINMVNYGSINSMPLQAVYNIGTSVVDLINALKDGNNANGEITNLLFGISEMLGISAKNIKNIVVGVTNIFSGAKALELNNMLYGYSQNYLSQQFNETKDIKYLRLLMQEYKVACDDNVINEIARLKKLDCDVMPSNYLTEYKDQPLSSYQIAQFKEYYDLSNKQVSELLKITDYKSQKPEKQAKMISYIFDAYYEYAKCKVLNIEPTTRFAKLLYANNGEMNLAKLVPYYLHASSLTETVSGSRKQNIINYLNSIKGLNKQEKEQILLLLGITSKK